MFEDSPPRINFSDPRVPDMVVTTVRTFIYSKENTFTFYFFTYLPDDILCFRFSFVLFLVREGTTPRWLGSSNICTHPVTSETDGGVSGAARVVLIQRVLTVLTASHALSLPPQGAGRNRSSRSLDRTSESVRAWLQGRRLSRAYQSRRT